MEQKKEPKKQPEPEELSGWSKAVADAALQPGQWICHVCLVRNERTSTSGTPVLECAACTMLRPGFTTETVDEFDEHYRKPAPFDADLIGSLHEQVAALEGASPGP